MNLNLNQKPWTSVLWSPQEKVMLMGSSVLTKLLFLFMYGRDVINTSELTKLKTQYSSKLNVDETNVQELINQLPILP